MSILRTAGSMALSLAVIAIAAAGDLWQKYQAVKAGATTDTFESAASFWLGLFVVALMGYGYWLYRAVFKPLTRLHQLAAAPLDANPDQRKKPSANNEITDLGDRLDELQAIQLQLSNRLKQTHTARQDAEGRFKALVENVSLAILFLDTDGTIIRANQAAAAMFKKAEEQLVGARIAELLPSLKIRGGLFRQILNAGVFIELDAEVGHSISPVELSCAELTVANQTQYILMLYDISQRKQYEDRVRNLNQRLINTSRQAGMAEIATSILHSVGNVLNSVNTSVAMLQQGLEKNQLEGLQRSIEMLRQEGASLFDEQGKGPQLLEYLEALTRQLYTTDENNLQELALLRQNINHIAEIVSAQQKFSGKSGVIEKLNVRHLLEEAVNINVVSLENNKVEIVRDYEPTVEIFADRSKLIQILVNLIRNANEAMMPPHCISPQLRLSADIADSQVIIVVQDNGHGITAQNMQKMFRYGFTTKPQGHGFGLHSCALAAKEMFGRLEVQSDGDGKGARFTLTLPVNPADRERQQIESIMTPSKETGND